MENQAALTIMRALASGMNPETGEKLEAESICRRPQIVKVLNRALGALLQLVRKDKGLAVVTPLGGCSFVPLIGVEGQFPG